MSSPASSSHYDLVVIGSGQAGNPLSSAFLAKGKRVALIESGAVGGTCVNYGCTPTKTMVASAEVASMARRGGDYGVRVGAVSVDMEAVVARKNKIVMQSRGNNEKRFSKGVDLFRGVGSFTGPKQIKVTLNEGGERMLSADCIVIDTGLSPTLPDIPGINNVPHLDNVSIMELDRVPEHLIVLGGGYIGLEFGQMFRRFGSQVTIIQHGPQLLGDEDQDVAEEVTVLLREDGITILLDSTASTVAAMDENAIRVTVGQGQPGSTLEVEGTHLLIAAGRKPNTAALNLAAVGISTDEHGYVLVDEKLETSVPGVFAVGDVKGGPAFTHISYDDFRILRANLLEGASRTTPGRPVPYCVFIDPQLGRIGLSEREAQRAGRKYRLAKIPMKNVARAFETDQTRGFMKALVDPDTAEILGAAILGADGGEIMSMLQIAMMGRLPYTALRDAILAHPTFAESLNSLFMSLDV